MSFFKDLVGIAAPAVGTFLGGPVGGAIGSAIGGAIAGGGSGGVNAANKATQQQLEAIQNAQNRINLGAETSQGFFNPYSQVGQRGVDLSNQLANPQALFDATITNNPLFDLSLNRLDSGLIKGAASKGRLSAGDTYEGLANNTMLAAQPFMDRQRQDILNLLNFGQGIAGQQSNIETNASRTIADLLTGAGATQAAGTVSAQNQDAARRGNLFDIGSQLFGNQDVQNAVSNIDFGSMFGFGGTSTPTTSRFGTGPAF